MRYFIEYTHQVLGIPSITHALSTRQHPLPLVSPYNHILKPSPIVHQAKLNSALSPTQNPRYTRTSP